MEQNLTKNCTDCGQPLAPNLNFPYADRHVRWQECIAALQARVLVLEGEVSELRGDLRVRQYEESLR